MQRKPSKGLNFLGLQKIQFSHDAFSLRLALKQAFRELGEYLCIFLKDLVNVVSGLEDNSAS